MVVKTSLIKKLVSMILVVMMLLTCGVQVAFASDNTVQNTKKASYITSSRQSIWADGCSSVDSEIDAIEWWYNSRDGKYYLFLPATAKLEQLTIWHTFPSTVKVNGKQITDGASTNVFANQGEYTVTAGSKTYKLVVMKASADAGSIFLTTTSGTMSNINNSADKSVKEKGKLLAADAQGTYYNDALDQIKGRGNATWGYSKKPYNIKLKNKAELFGMSASKKWCLLAEYSDPTLIRNQILHNLANDVGLDYSPGAKTVDLYANGKYLGAYTVTEKVEVGKNNLVKIKDLQTETEDLNSSIDIEKLPMQGTKYASSNTYKYYNIPNNPSDITGGYLLEFELHDRYPDEASGFVSKNGQPVVIKRPEFASRDQVRYIRDEFQKLEDAILAKDFNRVSQYLDIESAALMYLIQEYGMNLDAGITSFYLYKDSSLTSDGKFHMAPTWDFDKSLGNYNSRDGVSLTNPNNWWANRGNLFEKGTKTILTYLWQIDEYKSFVKTTWQETFFPAVNVLLGNTQPTDGRQNSIDGYAATTGGSARMNFKYWNLLGTSIADTGITSKSSYSGNIDYLKSFITKRAAFLDSKLGESSGQSKTIYFDNSSKNWSSVKAYFWVSGSNGPVTWPGTSMTNVKNSIYKAEVPYDCDMVIFNNGSSQTADLLIPTDSKNLFTTGNSWSTYTEETTTIATTNATEATSPTLPIEGNITVYFDNSNTRFSNVYAYVWKNGTSTSPKAWPGTKANHVEGNIYSYTFDGRLYDSIIFNGGSGAGQTVNIVGVSNNDLYFGTNLQNNKWSVSKSTYVLPTEPTEETTQTQTTGVVTEPTEETTIITEPTQQSSAAETSIVTEPTEETTIITEPTQQSSAVETSVVTEPTEVTTQPTVNNNITVYFDNTKSKFSNVYAYVWKNGTSTSSKAWPGEKTTHVEGNIYSYTFDGSLYNCIIFNGGSGAGQTGNITMVTDGELCKATSYTNSRWAVERSPYIAPTVGQTDISTEQPTQASTATEPTTNPTDNKITVYFNNANSRFSTVNAYIWKSGTTTSPKAWPGEKATYVTDNIYSYTFDASLYDCIIFNGGSGSYKTVNITAVKADTVYKATTSTNGVWDVEASAYAQPGYFLIGTFTNPIWDAVLSVKNYGLTKVNANTYDITVNLDKDVKLKVFDGNKNYFAPISGGVGNNNNYLVTESGTYKFTFSVTAGKFTAERIK